MDTVVLSNMVSKLSRSVNELEVSVIQAYDSFLEKYGSGHEYIKRLESYFTAIDKQREYIDVLERCLHEKDYETIYHISNKIAALSEMIKTDAKAFFFSMNSGEGHEAVEETIH